MNYVDRVLYCSCYRVVVFVDVVFVVVRIRVRVRVVVVYSRHCFHVRSGVHIEPLSIQKTAPSMIVLGIVQITHHTLPSELDGAQMNTIPERIMSNPQPRMRIRIEK